jgi:SH3-like domain-containing protein
MSLSKSRLALIAALLLPMWAHTLQAREMVSVDRAEINMRAGAGTGHATLWALIRGYPLVVTGRKGRWLKVSDFENDTGWVYGPLVGNKPHHVVKARAANIRSAPNTRSRIVGRAERGEVLRTVERRDSWVKVQQQGGVRGWVARRLLWGW